MPTPADTIRLRRILADRYYVEAGRLWFRSDGDGDDTDVSEIRFDDTLADVLDMVLDHARRTVSVRSARFGVTGPMPAVECAAPECDVRFVPINGRNVYHARPCQLRARFT